MSDKAITASQPQARTAVSRACLTPTYDAPLRRELVHDSSDAWVPERPCGNPACHRHGYLPRLHPRNLASANKRRRLHARLVALSASAAPSGAAAPKGGRDGEATSSAGCEDLVDAHHAELASLDYAPVPSEAMLADLLRRVA